MDLAIATSFDYSVPIDEQLPLVAAAGFTHISLGARESHSGYLLPRTRDALRAGLQQNHLSLCAIHGPTADRADAVSSLAAVARAAAHLSAKIVVFHASGFDLPTEDQGPCLQRILNLGHALIPIAEETGVIFALENVMPGPATEVVRRALERLPAEHFGFCYDSAHDQIGGPRPFGLLIEPRHRLVAVHLSDRRAAFVDHLVPGDGFIDWASLAAILREAPFFGPLHLEVSINHAQETDPRRFLAHAYERACWLHRLVEGDDDSKSKSP